MTVRRNSENLEITNTPTGEFYCQHTQYLKQTQLQEMQERVERLEQLIRQQQEMIEKLHKEDAQRAKRELSNMDQLLQNLRNEVNETKRYLPYVAGAIDKGNHLRAFQMFTDVFTQIYDRCNDIYQNFDKMSTDERFYAVAGVSMMIAGATLMIVSFTHPAAVSGGPVVGAAVATVGAYLARQAVMAHTGEKGEKLHESFGRLITALSDFTQALFAAPGKAVNYAFNKFKATSSVNPEDGFDSEYTVGQYKPFFGFRGL